MVVYKVVMVSPEELSLQELTDSTRYVVRKRGMRKSVIRKMGMKKSKEALAATKKAYDKKYRDKNRDKLNAYDRQYHKDNCVRLRAQQVEYSKKNPEVNLRAKKKELEKLGGVLNLTDTGVIYALMSWAKTIKKRDNNKCTWCNSVNNLRVHHIWHKVFCPESALDVDNGITLCHDCHMEQHRLDKL